MNPSQFPDKPSRFLLSGPSGALEVATSQAASPVNATIIVCHPHPLFEGTMNNKVVTTVARTFEHVGFHTVRFNYRGVGKSEGSYGEMVGEVEDLMAVIDWVKQVRPQDDIWLAGFSFGAYIAASGSTRTNVAQLIAIAPAVHHADFDALNLPHSPWLVVQGDADEVVPPDAVMKWLETFDTPPHTIILEGGSHFFHGRLIELRDRLLEALDSQIKHYVNT